MAGAMLTVSVMLTAALLMLQPRVPIGPVILLLLIFGVSLWMFVVLSRRWTSHRMVVVLQEWARERSFHLMPLERAFLPQPLSDLPRFRQRPPRVRWMLTDPTTVIVQIEPWELEDGGELATEPAAIGAEPKRSRRNVLIRAIDSKWSPTGLRPTAASQSLLDLFSLTSFPTATGTERFTVFGTDSLAARQLAHSPIKALLPPDLGLLLAGHYLVLDFSARPFDPIEFGRMIALADQLARVT